MFRTRDIWLPPLLLAVAPILMLAAHNADQIMLSSVLLTLVMASSAAAILLCVCRLFAGTWPRATLIATIAILVFFSYGHLHTAIASLGVFSRSRLIHYLLLPTAIIGMGAAAVYVWRTQRELLPACRTLTLLGAIACAMAVVRLTLSYESPPSPDSYTIDDDLAALQVDRASLTSRNTSGRLPDIYYIILDGYARADVLSEDFDFDNQPFLDQLRERGFFIADDSHSNYMMTFISLASSLNMRYVDDDVRSVAPGGKSRARMHAILWNHRVGRLLKEAGYELVHYKTGWTGTDRSDIADRLLPQTAPEFQMMLASTTMLKPLLSLNLIPYFSGPTGGWRYHFIFDSLQKTPPRTGRPRFVFAHLICPHPPGLVDRTGNVIRREEVAGIELGNTRLWANRREYLEQVEFCNRRVVEIVDQLVANSDPPPIIIVQADHGTAANLRFDSPASQQDAFIQERAPILNALLVPASIRQQLYDDITPVNTFRIVLSELLDLDLERLEDRVYFSWYEAPYDFLDVTESLRASARPTEDDATDGN